MEGPVFIHDSYGSCFMLKIVDRPVIPSTFDMVIVRIWGEAHIYEILKQIDSKLWFIDGVVLHQSPYSSDTATWNDDGDNSSYTLTESPHPRLSTTTPDSRYI